jgi:hypothetical protein
MKTRHVRISSRRAPAGLVFLFVLAIFGCGRPMGTVTGTVRYKGEPLPAGTVTFYGANEQSAVAYIKEDGTYEATKVPLGPMKVTVTTPSAPPTAEQAAKNPMLKKKNYTPPEVHIVPIPPRYGDPAKSGLSLEVIEGPQPYDIELKELP